MPNIVTLLKQMVEKNSSDLHLRVGMPPVFRVNGRLEPLNKELLTKEDMIQIARQCLTDRQKREFDKKFELDFALSLSKVGRFRINLYKQRGSLALAIRRVHFKIPTFEDLNLPSTLGNICEAKRGLVLVTGVTGSGKSTTLAAMIEYINRSRSENIITIEDPIEFVHRNERSIIAQREVGSDTHSFAVALREALRQDPDVILLGEIRDMETMALSLSAADTGHLIFSTLHTTDAVQTINRAISFFPPHQHTEVRLLLSSNIRAIISQRLLPRSDIAGRIPAIEILMGTATVKECIMDPLKIGMLKDLIAEGAIEYGMQTFDQALMKLLKDNRISLDVALSNASNPDDFKLRLAGIVGTSDRGWKEFEYKQMQEQQKKQTTETAKTKKEIRDIKKGGSSKTSNS